MLQLWPQTPQLNRSLLRSTQVLSHIVCPAGHGTGAGADPTISTQIPMPHCPLGQTVPQAPQLLGSFCKSTQAPQSVSPAAQVATHWPNPSQCTPNPQLLPHAPQLRSSPLRLAQNPPQSVSPGAQSLAATTNAAATHAPSVHTWSAVQTTPQPPQLVSSEKLTQTPLQGTGRPRSLDRLHPSSC